MGRARRINWKGVIKEAFFQSRDTSLNYFTDFLFPRDTGQSRYRRTRMIIDWILSTLTVVLYAGTFGNLILATSSVGYNELIISRYNGTVIENSFNSSLSSIRDISQSMFSVFFKESIWPYLNSEIFLCDEVTMDFGALTEFSLFSIEPDETTPTSIKYTNKEKIKQISKNGLTFYAKFPEQQGKQSTRVFVITVLFAVLFPVALKRLLIGVNLIYCFPFYLISGLLESNSMRKAQAVEVLIRTEEPSIDPLEESRIDPIEESPFDETEWSVLDNL